MYVKKVVAVYAVSADFPECRAVSLNLLALYLPLAHDVEHEELGLFFHTLKSLRREKQ